MNPIALRLNGSAQLSLPWGLSADYPQNPGWNMTFSTVVYAELCSTFWWYDMEYSTCH